MINSKFAEVGPALGSSAPKLENTLALARYQPNWLVGGRPMSPVPLIFQISRSSAESVALRWTSSRVKFELTSQELPRKTWSCGK